MICKPFSNLRKKWVLLFPIHKILAEILYVFNIFDDWLYDMDLSLLENFEPLIFLDA